MYDDLLRSGLNAVTAAASVPFSKVYLAEHRYISHMVTKSETQRILYRLNIQREGQWVHGKIVLQISSWHIPLRIEDIPLRSSTSLPVPSACLSRQTSSCTYDQKVQRHVDQVSTDSI